MSNQNEQKSPSERVAELEARVASLEKLLLKTTEALVEQFGREPRYTSARFFDLRNSAKETFEPKTQQKDDGSLVQ